MSELSIIQKENYKFFSENLQQWLKDPLYVGKFLVIHGSAVKGIYDTFQAAFKFSVDNLPLNECVIQQVLNPSEMIGYLHMAI